jgi:hypothetical protein
MYIRTGSIPILQKDCSGSRKAPYFITEAGILPALQNDKTIQNSKFKIQNKTLHRIRKSKPDHHFTAIFATE